MYEYNNEMAIDSEPFSLANLINRKVSSTSRDSTISPLISNRADVSSRNSSGTNGSRVTGSSS